MSELAQRIITSHKEAAKRALVHLGKTRKLKLSATESLELVACVLGVSNWQTLLAMAKDERGPRISEEKSRPAPAGEVSGGVSTSTLSRLRDYFSTWGEHPNIPKKDWQYLVENDDTRLGYWEHVEAECDRLGIMLPWERDALFDYKVTQAAGISVCWSSDEEPENDWVITDRWGYIFESNGSTEKEALQKATSSILRYVSDVVKMRAADFERYSESDWFAAIARVHAPLFAAEAQSNQTSSDELDDSPSGEPAEGYLLLPGEMTKTSRKFSQDVSLCRALSITPEYSSMREDETLYWTIGENQFFATEDEAWRAGAQRLRNAVVQAQADVAEVWDELTIGQKIDLSLQVVAGPIA